MRIRLRSVCLTLTSETPQGVLFVFILRQNTKGDIMNEQIVEQLNGGHFENKYLYYSKKSKPTLLSPRTQQTLNYLLLGYEKKPNPQIAKEHLQEVNETSNIRQMRYFGAWCLDQWDYAAKHLQKTGYSKEAINDLKDDFISALHEDFTSGVAYEYADDWYQAFPDGGHFNPMRYQHLYCDEKHIAHLVSEYIQCNFVHPAIASLMSYPKPDPFNHTLLKHGGSITLNYPSESNVRDILASMTNELDMYVAENIGEDESIRRDKRVFVTDSIEYTDGRSTCAVLYDSFDTVEKNYLASSMRAAIMEHIPLDYWQKYSINVAVEAGKVTQGEMDMARLYLQNEESAILNVQKMSDGATLNDSLLLSKEKENSNQFH